MSSPYRKEAGVKQEEQFPLEKITSMGAVDYCASRKKDLRLDYEVRVIQVRSGTPFKSDTKIPDIRELLASNVPGTAEMVTDYQAQIAMNNFLVLQYATGIALIPKPKEEISEQELPDTG